jgi:hypothetical protein
VERAYFAGLSELEIAALLERSERSIPPATGRRPGCSMLASLRDLEHGSVLVVLRVMGTAHATGD